MTPEEYTDQRETLARQFRRCQNKDDRDRLQSKIGKLDDSFESGFYGRVLRTSRPASEQRLQAYGVV